MTQLNRVITARVSEAEFEAFRERAGMRGITTSSLLRELLTLQAKPDDATRIVLSEILAMRTIMINLLHKIGTHAVVTVDTVNDIIRQADREKANRADARL